jgi:RND superfamily putative drug exporter
MHRQSNTVGKLAYYSARHKWIVLAAWIGVLAVAFVFASGIGDVLGKNSMGAVTESEKAHQIMDDNFGSGGPPMEWVVVESTEMTVDDGAFSKMVGDLAVEIASHETVTGVVSYLDGAPGMVGQDGHAALISVVLLDEDRVEENAAPVVTSVKAADADHRFRVTVIGEGSINAEVSKLAEETLAKGELIGIGVALVILFFVFGAAVAAGLPILLALAALVL